MADNMFFDSFLLEKTLLLLLLNIIIKLCILSKKV